MKLKELKKQVDILLKQEERNGSDMDVVVQTQGIGGPCEPVKHLSCGFDWYSGKAVIVTENLLSNIRASKHSKLKKLYLLKASNLNKISKGETLVAKFKQKEKEFSSKLDAEIWLYGQVDEELS